MSDTPETDSVIAADSGDSGFIRDLCELSRKLERERDEARREIERLNIVNVALDESTEIAELRAEVERLKAQSNEQNRCMNQLRELWKHLTDIENKYDERLAYHLDELIERLKAEREEVGRDAARGHVLLAEMRDKLWKCQADNARMELMESNPIENIQELEYKIKRGAKTIREALDAMKGAE